MKRFGSGEKTLVTKTSEMPMPTNPITVKIRTRTSMPKGSCAWPWNSFLWFRTWIPIETAHVISIGL
jgi:hypothetical protein